MAEIFPVVVVSILLFFIGAVGFVVKRNILLMVLSAELMLHGVALNFVAFSRLHGNLDGQIFAIFILIVSASEAGLALAIALGAFRRVRSLDIAIWTQLREQDLPAPVVVEEKSRTDRQAAEYPGLAVAGRVPTVTDRNNQGR